MPGSFIQLANGMFLDLANPKRSAFTVSAIASALSKLCRWAGNCEPFFSVAQHSLMVSLVTEPPLALIGLFHDAGEVATGDIPGPLKALVPQIKTVEKRITGRIFRELGLDFDKLPLVKPADRVCQATEKRDLMPATRWDVHFYGDDPTPLKGRIRAMQPNEARAAFLARYAELMPDGTLIGGPLCRHPASVDRLKRAHPYEGYERCAYFDSQSLPRYCFLHRDLATWGVRDALSSLTGA